MFFANLNSSLQGIDTVYSDPERYLGLSIHQRNDTVILDPDWGHFQAHKEEFVEGPGLVKSGYNQFVDDTNSGSDFSLVYYSKIESEEEWGEPLILMVSETNHFQRLSLFPNPGEDLITLDLKPEDSGDVLWVYNVNGKILKKLIINQLPMQIDVNDWNPGLYLFKVGNRSIKFVR